MPIRLRRGSPRRGGRPRPASWRRVSFGRLRVPIATAIALLALGAGVASPEPSSVTAKRAELARLQEQVQAIDDQVEDAAEAYNGARYQLGQVQGRIEANSRDIVRTQERLEQMRAVLAERLRALYTTPQPTLAEVLLSSGSVSEAVEQLDLLGRVGRQDANVVSTLEASRRRLADLRAQLVADRADAQRQVAARERQRRQVEGLLRERQRVLSSAEGELRVLLARERERERREAAAQATLARQRLAAQPQAPSDPAPSAPEQSSPAPAAPTDPPESSPDPEPTAPAADGANARAASIAMKYLGVPYVWGGASPAGFDCSGLASYAYAQVGKSVPHYTVSIWNAFSKVSAGDLQPGDLVFFRGLGHMGIYIGGGQYVNAPRTGDVVKVSSMSGRSDYVGAVRP